MSSDVHELQYEIPDIPEVHDFLKLVSGRMPELTYEVAQHFGEKQIALLDPFYRPEVQQVMAKVIMAAQAEGKKEAVVDMHKVLTEVFDNLMSKLSGNIRFINDYWVAFLFDMYVMAEFDNARFREFLLKAVATIENNAEPVKVY